MSTVLPFYQYIFLILRCHICLFDWIEIYGLTNKIKAVCSQNWIWKCRHGQWVHTLWQYFHTYMYVWITFLNQLTNGFTVKMDWFQKTNMECDIEPFRFKFVQEIMKVSIFMFDLNLNLVKWIWLLKTSAPNHNHDIVMFADRLLILRQKKIADFL